MRLSSGNSDVQIIVKVALRVLFMRVDNVEKSCFLLEKLLY